MDPSHRRKATLGSVLIGIGILCALLTYCRVGAGQSGRMLTVGYATGKELFNGVCHTKPTLWECTNCCLTLGSGLPHSEQLACVDLCIEKFEGEGGSQLAVVDSLLTISDIVRNQSTTDYVAFNNAKRMLRLCQNSRHDRVARMAKILCRDLKIVEPVQA